MRREMLEVAVDKVMAGEGAQKLPLVEGEVWAVWIVKGQVKLRRIGKDVILANEAAQGEGRPSGSPA